MKSHISIEIDTVEAPADQYTLTDEFVDVSVTVGKDRYSYSHDTILRTRVPASPPVGIEETILSGVRSAYRFMEARVEVPEEPEEASEPSIFACTSDSIDAGAGEGPTVTGS